jgi:hypothetical protein
MYIIFSQPPAPPKLGWTGNRDITSSRLTVARVQYVSQLVQNKSYFYKNSVGLDFKCIALSPAGGPQNVEFRANDWRQVGSEWQIRTEVLVRVCL